MKKKIMLLVLGLLLIGGSLYAASGDLIVNGKVGIGTTNPAYMLDVQKNTAGNVQNLRVSGDNGAGDGGSGIILSENNVLKWSIFQRRSGSPLNSLAFSTSESDYASAKMIITTSGNVGIGTTSPAYKLDVAGQVASNGTPLTSDIRFKKNIQTIDDPLSKVLSLHGVTYEWKTDEYKDKGFPEGRHYGVIAQEIENVLPEVVQTRTEGTKTVSYTEIIPVLIEAIKEQQKEIEQLKKKLAERE